MDAIDLFSGAGGLSKGLDDAGIEIGLAIDSWEAAVDTYRRNMLHPVQCMDLLDVDCAIEELKARKPDLIAGGPPCQDFSSAGKRICRSRTIEPVQSPWTGDPPHQGFVA